MKKRILYGIIMMIMCVCMLTVSAYAADEVASGTCGDNLTWALDNEGTLTISGTGAMDDYSQTTSSYYEIITTAPWWNYSSSIKKLNLTSGITSIGECAFCGCDKIAGNITIPDSVESIDWGAFLDCTSLSHVTIGDGVTKIYGFAFGNCTSLVNVDFGESISIIYEAAFDGCESLVNIILPDGVAEIWESAFASCTSLTNISIPGSVTKIMAQAFNNCTSLQTINYGGTKSEWISIANNSCWETNNNYKINYLGIEILDYTINDDRESYSVTGIGNCYDVVVIPSEYNGLPVTRIGHEAFSGCTFIESVIISDSVEWIEYCAFFDCSSLSHVKVGNGVTDIDGFAFGSCTSIKSIDVGDNIKIIHEAAFDGCISLEEIVISDTIEEIWVIAFNGCTSLTNITYEGTISQWNSIYKETNNVSAGNWDDGTGNYSVYCTDGTITKSGEIIYYSSPYIATLSTTTSSVSVGDTVYLTLTSNVPFSAAELSLSYDTTRLTFNKSASTLNNASVTDNTGTLTLADYGIEKSSYTLVFNAVSAGTAEITLTSAAFSDAEDAASEDLTAAAITTDTISITINEPALEVTLPDILDGNTTVDYGNDYTFRVISDGRYYDYVVTATMAGEPVEIIDNGDGTYTIKNVTGELVITATRTPKEFTIEFVTDTDVDLPDNDTIVYGKDYTFDIPETAHYSTNIEEARYVNLETDVPYSIKDGIVTIKGTAIIDDIVITINQVLADATVTVEGNGASDADGYAPYVTIGEAYTLTIIEDARYDYVVTAKVNGKDVTLTKGNGTYTISADDVEAGSVIFTITKALKTNNITVSKYLTLNDISLWLIINDVDKIDGMIYCYNDTAMYWSDKYSAYCTVVVSSDKPIVNTDNLSLINGSVTAVAYEMDSNKSGKMDANDAQFVYNMYNGMYSGITEELTAEKYLRADVNGDGTVNTQDAAAVINKVLKIN